MPNNIKKMKVLMTLYGPLPPYFLVGEAEASYSSVLPPKVSTLSGALIVTARLSKKISIRKLTGPQEKVF